MPDVASRSRKETGWDQVLDLSLHMLLSYYWQEMKENEKEARVLVQAHLW